MATVADVRCTSEFVSDLAARGMSAVRINSAHVTPDTFREMVHTIRSVNPAIKILMDTKGPEIRTTALDHPLSLSQGDIITLRSGSDASSRQCIYVMVGDMERYLTPGQEIILDDGEIRLEVVSIDGQEITSRVTSGGTLDSRKTVAFPSAQVPPLPAVSDRDRLNIEVAVECGIDMIAHSFVRDRNDVEAVRQLIDGSPITLYAKIECREALENLESITEAADGLLIARGDLGTHIPLSQVPAAQFRAVASARKHGKPTILATQILHSMLTRPAPTRAELSDITLAVLQGIDTLLLCGETAQGDFPRECVEIMSETIKSATDIPCRISMTI